MEKEPTEHWLQQYADEQGIIRFQGYVIDTVEMGVLHIANPDVTSTVTTWRDNSKSRYQLLEELAEACGWREPWYLPYIGELDLEFEGEWEFFSQQSTLYIKQGVISFEVKHLMWNSYEGDVCHYTEAGEFKGLFRLEGANLMPLLANLQEAAERLWGNG